MLSQLRHVSLQLEQQKIERSVTQRYLATVYVFYMCVCVCVCGCVDGLSCQSSLTQSIYIQLASHAVRHYHATLLSCSYQCIIIIIANS